MASISRLTKITGHTIIYCIVLIYNNNPCLAQEPIHNLYGINLLSKPSDIRNLFIDWELESIDYLSQNITGITKEDGISLNMHFINIRPNDSESDNDYRLTMITRGYYASHEEWKRKVIYFEAYAQKPAIINYWDAAVFAIWKFPATRTQFNLNYNIYDERILEMLRYDYYTE